MTSARQFFNNSIWIFSEKIIRLAVGFFVNTQVLRHLGTDDTGVLSFLQGLFTLVQPILGMGIEQIVIREIARGKISRADLFGTSLGIRAIGLVLSFIPVLVYLFVFAGTMSLDVVGWLAVAFGFQFWLIFDFFFQATLKGRASSIVQLTVFVVGTLLRIFGLANSKDLSFFAMIFGVEAILQALLLGGGFYREQFVHQIRFNSELAKKLIAESWPLLSGGLMVSIYLRSDQFFLKHLMGFGAVGVYSAATRLSEVFYMIPAAFAVTSLPVVTKSHDADKSQFERQMMLLMGMFFWFFVFVGLGTLVFADWGVRFLYGDKFEQAAGVLKIHIWAGISVGMNYFFSHWYVVKERSIYVVIGTGVGAVINLGLNAWLIPVMGIDGAAVATLISYFAPTIFISIFFDPNVGRLFINAPMVSYWYVLAKVRNIFK